MKAMTLLVMTAICAASGCMSPCRTGWEFRVLKPPTVDSTAVINQTPGMLGISPLAAYPAQPVGLPGRPLAYMGDPEPPRPGPTLAARASCTMQDLCDSMERIERLLRTQALPMPRPDK